MKHARWRAAATLLVASVAGCGTSNQIIISDPADPYNFEAAQRTANQECAARGGGSAQFVMVLNNARSSGATQDRGPGPPDFIYRCMPR